MIEDLTPFAPTKSGVYAPIQGLFSQVLFSIGYVGPTRVT